MKAEITHRIIDNDFVKENLVNMLPGTILLDENFSIIAASKDVCNLAMHNEKKLFGQSFFDIILHDGLKDIILQQLNTVGYFQRQPAKIIHQFGNHTEVELSGFYLGLLSDLNTQILITVKDLSQISMYKERLQVKAAEFNELLYRSYHDLMGPLATIKGLVNLNAHVKLEEERNGIIDMVGKTAKLLESRIKNLAEIFESGKTLKETHYISKFNLTEFIYKALNTTQIKLKLSLNESDHRFLPTELPVKKIFKSFFDFVKVLKENAPAPELVITLSVMANQHLLLDLELKDFSFSDKLKNIIGKKVVYASEVIHHEDCLKYYIFRNQIMQTEGIIDIFSEGKEKLNLKLLLPSEIHA